MNNKTNQNEISSHDSSKKTLDSLIDDSSVKPGDLLSQSPSKIELLRLKTLKFMASSFFGHVYTNFFLFVSIFSCGQYIYQTYLHDNQHELRTILTYVEIILAILFLFDWCLSLFLAEQRWDHFFSFFAMVDFATIVPTALANIFFRQSVDYDNIQNFSDAVNYIVHGAYTLRILRALRLHRKLGYIADEVDRFLYSMLLSVLTMVLFDSAVMQYLERHVQDYEFHSWMYYTVVTICTIGYGDITPSSTLGRFAAMFLILFAIIFVPQQTNQLIEKMSVLSVYARKHYKPIGNAKHVLICGEMKTTFLEEFFRELFHEDHENLNLNALVLQSEPPSIEIHEILRDPLFSIVVHYFQGSPLNNHDLKRVHVSTAVAIFIMGNKFSVKPDEDDAKTILQYFSIRKYLQCLPEHSDPFYCLQLIRPDNKRHLGLTNEDESKEIVICLNEMKMGLLAKTCMFPGTSTFIFNLLTSFGDNDDDDDDDDDNDNEDEDDKDIRDNKKLSSKNKNSKDKNNNNNNNNSKKNNNSKEIHKITDKLITKVKKKRSRDAEIHPEQFDKTGALSNLNTDSIKNFDKKKSKDNDSSSSSSESDKDHVEHKSHQFDSNGNVNVNHDNNDSDSHSEQSEEKKSEKSDDSDNDKDKNSDNSDDDDDDDDDDNSEKSDNIDDDENSYWKKEYLKGCQWEIYTTDMADVFCGVRFIDIARRLYNKLGVVLIALRVTDLHSTRNRVRVVLNPADFIIPTKKRYRIQGFVIAKNKASSDLSYVGTAGSEVSGLENFASSIGRNLQSINSPNGHNNHHQRSFTPVNQIDPNNNNPNNNNNNNPNTNPPNNNNNNDNNNRSTLFQVPNTSNGTPLHRKGSVGAISARNINTDGNLIQGTFSGGWQTLLASQHESNKLNESQNTRQERIQKMEDEFLRNNFFIREYPADINEVTINTSLPEEYPYIKDHMIIIAKGLSNLFDFIRPLRAKYLGKLRHIVLLFHNEIPVDIWRRISIFEGILYVRGSALEEADLIRSGIFRVSQVVVLADPDSTNGISSSSNNMDALVDADAIFTYHSVKRLNEKAHIVIEVVRQQNVGYLDTNTTESDYKFTPNFAAGTLFTSSMLDAVVCQTFYNPQIIRVLNKLISGTDHIPDKNGVQLLNENQQNSRNGLKSLFGSSLYQIPLPDGFSGKTYGQLFNYYANDGGLCIGVLRGTWTGMTLGPNSNRMPYVYTNPSSDMILYKCDKIFILSQKILTSYKSTIKEVIDSFNLANNAAAKKKKKAMNDLHNTIKSDLTEITTAQKSLEKSLSNLSVDLIKRFEDMIELHNNLNFIQTIPSNDGTNLNNFGNRNGDGTNSGSNSNRVTPVKDLLNNHRDHRDTHTIERTPSRSRIAEELQRRTVLKKSASLANNNNNYNHHQDL